MKIPLYQIDAFTDKIFHGNPAAVCVLPHWLDDHILQGIAAENNLAETAFLVKAEKQYEIRWFTPKVEVDLCGHATLAAAFVLHRYYGEGSTNIQFYSSRSGKLPVNPTENGYILDFPTDSLLKIDTPEVCREAFGRKPLQALKGKTDLLLIFEDESFIQSMSPDLTLISSLPYRGVIVSSPGSESDFVSRFFAPQSGIDEDPVTGSAHTSLTPYWAKALHKTTLTARQLSARQGELTCTLNGDRVHIEGQAVAYLQGEIAI